MRCPGPQRCRRCSADFHGEECGKTAHCHNCNDTHPPSSRECPQYQKEKAVIKIKVDHNLTYPEARKRIGNDVGSYAAAVGQQNRDRLKLDKLEKQMKEKDIQITQLLESAKKKNEQIERMMAYIKNIRTQQIITPTETNQPKTQHEKPQTDTPQSRNLHATQITATNMLLRSRSSSSMRPKRCETSKKSKRNTNNENIQIDISPDRQSPPLKKTNTAEETESADEVEMSDECVIDETPPSQRIRRSSLL